MLLIGLTVLPIGAMASAVEDGSAHAVGAVDDAYVFAPVCDGGLCDGSTPSYRVSSQPAPVATMTFEGVQTVPGSGVFRGDWCLQFAPGVEYSKVNGASASTTARVTESDLCLDLS